jgi:hypothetical protein
VRENAVATKSGGGNLFSQQVCTVACNKFPPFFDGESNHNHSTTNSAKVSKYDKWQAVVILHKIGWNTVQINKDTNCQSGGGLTYWITRFQRHREFMGDAQECTKKGMKL